MYTHLSSPHRMAVPPPHYAGHLTPSSLAFVSKVLLGAIAVALGVAVIVAAPQTVLIPIASVLAAGVVASVAVVGLDRRFPGRSRRPGGPGSGARPTIPERESLEPGEALGLASFALLLFALVSPAGLRVLLAAAGLFGLGAFRLAAARSGWARRGVAWRPYSSSTFHV